MSWWGSTGTADATEQADERQRQVEERQRQAEERQRQAEEAAERERQRKAAERQRQEEERKATERQRKAEETDRLRAAARERAIRACTRQEPDPYHTPGYASKEETSGLFSGW